jgi:hypothetical protein
MKMEFGSSFGDQTSIPWAVKGPGKSIMVSLLALNV